MPHELTFYVLAALTVGAAIAAMTLRNLVHCALCVATAFAGLAMVYLQLDAEFVGFAQLLVYVGAVGILIVFAVLLTRGADIQIGSSIVAKSWMPSFVAAALVFVCIMRPILNSPSLRHAAPPNVTAPTKEIGKELMSGCVVPLETAGLLLTAALLGGVVIAMKEKPATRLKAKISPTPRLEEEPAQP